MSNPELQISGRLGHMREAIANIKSDIGDLSETGFMIDGKTQRAVIEGIMVIGEAASALLKLAPGIEDKLPNIWQQLRDASNMRNVLAHEYFRVDPTVVWATVNQHIWKLDDDLRLLAANFTANAKD